MSVTGAAVCVEAQLEVGTPLAIGACVGRVTRVFANGVAVKFVERQNRHELDRLVVRPLPLLNRGTKVSDWEDAEAEQMET
jgi:hypothetical protein